MPEDILFYRIEAPSAIVGRFVDFTDGARKAGILSLEGAEQNLPDDAPPSRILGGIGLPLVLDGTDPQLVRHVLENRSRSFLRTLEYRWYLWRSYLERCRETGSTDSAVEALATLALPGHPENVTAIETIRTLGEKRFAESHGEAVQAKDPYDYDLVAACVASVRRGATINTRELEGLYKFYCQAFQTGLDAVIQGVLSIQSGDNPRIVRTLLEALFGIMTDSSDSPGPSQKAGGDGPSPNLSEEEIDALLSMDDSKSHENLAASASLMQIDDRAIQRIFREFDHYSIAAMLSVVSASAGAKMLRNLSRNAAADVLEIRALLDKQGLKPEQQKRAVQFFQNIAQKLVDAGEIRLE